MNAIIYFKLLDYIKDNITQKDTLTELEARFELDFTVNEIVKKLRSLQVYNIQNEYSDVEYHGDYRRVIYSDGRVVKEKKDMIHRERFDIQGYPISIVLSNETPTDFTLINNPRISSRNRYIIKEFGDCDLHLTEIRIGKDIKQQIEIEYDISKLTPDYIITPIKLLFDILYVQSLTLLNMEDMLNILYPFNDLVLQIKKEATGRITRMDTVSIHENRLVNFEDKPINITKDQIPAVKTNNYFVTNKLNGTRYYLFIYNSIMYLVGKSGSKISKAKFLVWKFWTIPELGNHLTFILDGEYFNGINGKLFFAFDIIYHASDRVIKLKYDGRLHFLHKICEFLDPISPIKMKYIQYGTYTSDIISNMKETFGLYWNIENDGLIYTPRYGMYGDKSTLTLKWKFPIHMSADVSVRKVENDKYACYAMGKENKLIRFTDKYLVEKQNIPNDSIVEVAYDKYADVFYMLRLRPDKDRPNFITVVEDFWRDTLYPIPIQELAKKPLYIENMDEWVMYRKKCANAKKAELIGKIPKDSIVLDIGFGKGGDMSKYIKQGIKYIIAIEPDKGNIQEFCKRFSLKYTENEIQKFTVQQTDIILLTGSAADPKIGVMLKEARNTLPNLKVVVTAFFSLTYFFDPLDSFVNLVQNLMKVKPQMILGTVMDGNDALRMINDYTWNPNDTGLNMLLISKEYNQTYISISSSATVSGHYEYLVDMSRLKDLLKRFGYNLDSYKNLEFQNRQDNLLYHFSRINHEFIFNLARVSEDNNSLTNRILDINDRLGIHKDASYLFPCVKNSKELNALLYNKPILKNKILRTLNKDGNKDIGITYKVV